jgi:pyruvate dehydrogenase E2 component (dihydrolipoamide acetyltransferase)
VAEVDFAKFGPVETKPLARIQKLSGPYLHRNWISIPHVTQFDEADITDLEAFRKAQTVETEKKGFKLTMLAFMIKACVTALRQYPQFNSSLDKSGENIILKKYFHIGVAVDTPGGLVVPVVRDADRKGVFDIARELSDISKLARDGKLKPGDMQGGTFSDLEPGRHRRHRVHADHQRARSRDPRRLAQRHAPGVDRQGILAALDAAALASPTNIA